ncbi:MAG: colicin E5-related ribonuclease [Gammaproteobacteria bacterium]|nr:colicin E5-related ribonuclease [Gammaproteobacteria bacterium]
MTTSIVDDANATTTLTRSHTYDDYGRLASTTYPSSATDAVKVDYEYNRHGYRWKLKHGSTALVEVKKQTAYGQSKAETYGNGVRTRLDYDKLGRLTDIDTVRRGTKLQDNTYAWRSDGSLQRRTARAGSSIRREHFAYDYLNRLTRAATFIAGSATASRTLTFGYDLRGNLKTRASDVSADDDVTSVYPETSNRLTSATVGDVPYTFPHDTSGHIEQYECKDPDENDEVDPCADVDDTFIDWNARGLAEKVTVGESKTADTPAARDSFRYGPDGARYFKKSEWTVGSGAAATLKTSRKYYAGAYEKTVTAGGETVERTRIGDSVVHVRTTPASMMASAPPPVFEYVHRDHLGSVEAVTDQAGNELIVLAHDPYGERRKKDWTGQLTDTEIESLLNAQGERVSRGFTRHEHLDRTGLIHMNGRMYDPRLGRFLSPDPIVGDPTSSQSWNLYSYVRNNPLSYVDPTGKTELEIIIVTASRCDWVCGEDINYWLEWWYWSNGSWIHYSSSQGYSYSDEIIRSIVEQALRALKTVDQSVADELAHSMDKEFDYAVVNEPGLDEGWGGILTDPLTWVGGFGSAASKLPALARSAWSWIRSLFVRGPGATHFGPKILSQLERRGWTTDDVLSAIANPVRTVRWRDRRHLPGGGRLDDPATVYYSRHGGYVVRNDRTGDIVQISDRNKPNWKAPWD